MITQVSKELWINVNAIARVVLYKDVEDGMLEKARVYFIGDPVPTSLCANDTRDLMDSIERNRGEQSS